MKVHLAIGAILFGSLLGCAKGGAEKGKISGKVSVGDKAVTAGEIRFHGPNGAVATARINGDGSYSLPDLATGETKVTVHPPGLTGGGAAPKGTPKIDTGGTEGAPPPDASKSAQIPIKYLNPDSTDLKLTVKGGENTFDAKMSR